MVKGQWSVLCGIFVIDDKNRVLLQHRTDSNTWGIPGGGLVMGETVEEAAKREVFEETNLVIGEMKLFNVYSGQELHWIYPDGNEVYIVSTVFISRDYTGELKADGVESKDVRFFDLDNMPQLIPTNIPMLNDLRKKLNIYPW